MRNFVLKRLGVISGTLAALLLVPCLSAGSHKEHPFKYSVVDIPVSLAVGTVRTPEFAPPAAWYWILLQVEKPLPFRDMECMVGIKDGTPDYKECTKEPLIQAEWTVRNDGRVVSKGSSSGFTSGGIFANHYIIRFLGSFATEPGEKYTLELKFTKDGTPLNVANPHLIIVKQGNE